MKHSPVVVDFWPLHAFGWVNKHFGTELDPLEGSDFGSTDYFNDHHGAPYFIGAVDIEVAVLIRQIKVGMKDFFLEPAHEARFHDFILDWFSELLAINHYQKRQIYKSDEYYE